MREEKKKKKEAAIIIIIMIIVNTNLIALWIPIADRDSLAVDGIDYDVA